MDAACEPAQLVEGADDLCVRLGERLVDRRVAVGQATPDEPEREVDIHARLEQNLADAPLAGFVTEGLSPYGTPTANEGELVPTHTNSFIDPPRCPTSRFTELPEGVRHEIALRTGP